ncbi:MAG: DUF6049 family protein [Bifidobacteriaceae bacterium]|nr:DUF6049 family protein [Bifidobacteriaceae bacterium]
MLSTFFHISSASALILQKVSHSNSQTTVLQHNSSQHFATAAAQTSEISISIDSISPVITSSSGFKASITITNGSDEDANNGTLTIATNTAYTFVSRSDIQQWANNSVSIPTNNTITQISVPHVKAHNATTIDVDVPQDNNTLQTLISWGPKPLLISYQSANRRITRLQSFITRSGDGIHAASTPPLKITAVTSLSANSWSYNKEVADNYITDPDGSGISISENKTNSTENNSSSNTNIATNTNPLANHVVTLRNKEKSLSQKLIAALTAHPSMQILADPTYLEAIGASPKIAAISQPGNFDISAYTHVADNKYAAAGVDTSLWSAQTALQQYKNSTKSANDPRAIALEGQTQWSIRSLSIAKQQGYNYAISTNTSTSQDDSIVYTNNLSVPTNSGDITLLISNNTLSNLANGKATSEYAKSEETSAGRLARFIAQSAFYQMEQPYKDRNILVYFNNATADTINSFMSSIENATWLESTDLQTLASQTPVASGAEASSYLNETSPLNESQVTVLNNTLDTLQKAQSNLNRVFTAIITDKKQTSNDDFTTKTSKDEWFENLNNTFRQLALHSLSANENTRISTAKQASNFVNSIFNKVIINATDSITVLSETANLPVNVTNHLPYPIEIKVSSLTNSMEIVTSRISDVYIQPHSDTQTTFTIRVTTSGNTNANISLLDRNNTAFSTSKIINIKSSLQISDKSGLIIIIVAVVLGILGLYRQFNRVKDPDE